MPWKKVMQRGNHPVLFLDSVTHGMNEYALRKVADLDFSLQSFKHISGEVYLDEDECVQLVEMLQSRILDDSDYLKNLTNNYLKATKKLAQKAKSYGSISFKGKAASQVNTMFIEFMEEYNQCSLFFHLPFFIEQVLERDLREQLEVLLEKRKSTDRFGQVYSVLTYPTSNSLRKKHQLDILSIAQEIEKNDKLKKEFSKKQETVAQTLKRFRKINGLIKTHLDNYCWINTYLFDVVDYDIIDVVRELKAALKLNPEKELAEIKVAKSEKVAQAKALIKELKIPKKLQDRIKAVQEWNALRVHRMELFSMIHYYAYDLLDAIAQNFNMTYDDLIQLTYKEILGIMKFGLFNSDVLKQRKEEFGWVLENGKPGICTGYKFEEMKPELEEEIVLKDNKLYGTTAYSGVVEGKVHVVKTPYDRLDVKNFKQGDVLVASMISPEYTSLVRKAGAIVTDEGGILCHALILAREFHVPCLIGTNVATKVLEDGFSVKVNADEGYLKILKK